MKGLFTNRNGSIIIFLTALGFVNIIQAALTPLHNDEAYYWMYSRYPAWGYYDHPPMIALFIGLGYSFLKNELGVRLLTVLSQAATLFIAWNLCNRETRDQKGSVIVFILLVLLMPLFHVYGFIAVPDAPLLFFSAVFLLVFKRFIGKESAVDTVLLGLAMAGLVYSKYHGALLIILVIVSYPRLLMSLRFYAASFLALLLFVPHVLWQFENGFPSFQYHLSDRASGLDIVNVPEYILNQLLVHNPVLIIAGLILMFRTRSSGQFEKTLRVIIAGFFLFFFISSFRYHVEPHWTAAVSLPLLLILFNRSFSDWKGLKILKKAALLLIPLLIVGRLAVMIDIIPAEYLRREFHGTESRMRQISSVAKERPVVFTNSYQDPSMYTFLTGRPAHTLDNLAYRRSQYDIWKFEEEFRGREVLYVPHWLTPEYRKNLQPYPLEGGDTLWARVISDFQSVQRRCVLLDDPGENMIAGESREIVLRIFNPYPYPLVLDHETLPLRFQAAFFSEGRLKAKNPLVFSDQPGTIMPGDTITGRASFGVPFIDEGEYSFAITSEAGFLLDVVSSNPAKVSVSGGTKK